jgi:hypothetical protein
VEKAPCFYLDAPAAQGKGAELELPQELIRAEW